jgi:aminopeptidase-like protein
VASPQGASKRGIDWSRVPDPSEAGEAMHSLLREAFPLPRSLTGDGNRRTLELVSQLTPLEVSEVPTGEQVLDWTVPREWNVREAWIDDPHGKRVVDFRDSALHLVGYSIPIDVRLPLAELREHLHTDPSRPDVIPYRTSYHNESWGFCLPEAQAARLEDGEYHVRIDADLSAGSLTYAEAVIAGASSDEVMLSTYMCHPAQANDNLSGVVLLAQLGATLGQMELRRTHRLLFSPGSLGPITWLARNESRLSAFHAGLVASCAGDPGPFTYKRSRRGNSTVDKAVVCALRDSGEQYSVRDWIPWGGDERQFCSPGFNLPVGALSRSPADHFAEYHSSADNPDFVTAEALAGSFLLYLSVLDIIERDDVWVNQNPKGEPQLGRRGLYRSVGGGSSREEALLWVLSLSDGDHSLLDIAHQSALPFSAVAAAADALAECDLLRVATDDETLATAAARQNSGRSES